MAFSLERFRQVLRAERKARVGSRKKLAARAGINKTTIQRAESGPDVPGIDTAAKLIEAMPGLTLSSFFAELDLDGTAAVQGLPREADSHDTQRHVTTAVPSTAAGRAELLNFIDTLNAALLETRARLTRSDATARPRKTGRRRRSRGGHSETA